MISKEKVFFLNQLVDSMENAVKKLETANPEKAKKLVDFILSIQSEIRNIVLIVK